MLSIGNAFLPPDAFLNGAGDGIGEGLDLLEEGSV